MTLYQLFGVMLIATMMSLVFVVTSFVSSVRYRGKGIWHITIRTYFWRDERYKEWMADNRVYLWSALLVLMLCITILGLIGTFSQNRMFNRPEALLFVSPVLWFSIFRCIQWFIKKTKEHRNTFS